MLSTLLSYTQLELSHLHLNDLVADHNKTEVSSYLHKLAEGDLHTAYWQLRRQDDSLITCELTGTLLPSGLVQLIVRDITEIQAKESELLYISMHDPVTNICNRTCFEQEMRRLNGKGHTPVSIIICDVDGLKLINDCLGHDKGDMLLSTAAKIIKGVFREEDVVARIGGDEFAILLPHTSRLIAKKACRRLNDAIQQYNNQNTGFPLSISSGFATSTGTSANMGELFREADNNMYREKLQQSKNVRRKIIYSVLKTLQSRESGEFHNLDRIQSLAMNLGKLLSLPIHRLSALKMLVHFHNIGRVGIPARILNKKPPLTPSEQGEIRRHSEIGYRIAQSIPDLIPIADSILKHHEWWNGQGYPLRIQGEAIPLECRILAVASAYDRMTGSRPEGNLSHEAALNAIKKLSGVQFDPYIVDIFCNNFSSRCLQGGSKRRTLRSLPTCGSGLI